MSLQHILKAIADDADKQVRDILDEARSRRESRLAEARKQAAALRTQALAEAEAEAAHARARILHQVHLETLRRRVEVQETTFQAALQRARETLSQVRFRNDYPAIFAALLSEALAAQEPGATVRVTKEDLPLARRVLADLGWDAHLSSGLATWGGVEVHSSDNRIITRNTIESRLERAEPDLRPLLADILRAN
ncbi:MAG TPA: hypothetical protein EYP25_01970 [Anaerolineae bacterium]|nr:hypothetical protein [Caldilineae bacterium]HID33337.1 hypothetical protein [Anaerolineae bacterium]HIQ11761.1 hypothetical protein [Caldilineales bacterium]